MLYGVGTDWAWVYIPSIVTQFLMCLIVPYTLHFSLDHMKTAHPYRFHIAALKTSAHYVIMLLPFIALVYHPWARWVPFQNGTLMTAFMFVGVCSH